MARKADLMTLKNGGMNLEQAFNAYYKELVYFGNKMVANREAAEEIVADVFVALKNPEIDGIRFYLYKAVKNRCLNYLESIKSKKGKIVELSGDEWVEATTMIEVDYLKAMHAAIRQLKGTEKQVIDLLIEGKPIPEVALALNKSVDNVRSIKRHAINRLRKDISIVAQNSL